jgi:serine/threonine-protein kinase HipA
MTSPVGELAVDIEFKGVTRAAGVATFSVRGRRPITEFRYDRAFVRDGYDLDPSLLREGTSTLVEGLPGSFADSAPDWWGRNLICRQSRAQARERGEPAPLVTDVDFLVGVSDETRQGALRFRAVDSGLYLAQEMYVPELVALPELLASSDQVVTDPDDAHVHEALKALLAAGSGTLGGARPKASVSTGSELHIAKFPHPVDDQWDVMAWEMTVLDLAERVGIDTPAHDLVRIGGRSVLLIRRFDRATVAADLVDVAGQQRVGYVSASTLLGGNRSQSHDYLDLQAAVEDHSAAVDDDLADLWRRIAFSVAVHNTDDHLRNYGFLRRPEGWRLAPIFDVNPDPELARPRATTINGEAMRAREVDALREMAEYFGLSDTEATRQFDEILGGIGNWRQVAASHGIKPAEIERFAPVFDGLAR